MDRPLALLRDELKLTLTIGESEALLAEYDHQEDNDPIDKLWNALYAVIDEERTDNLRKKFNRAIQRGE